MKLFQQKLTRDIIWTIGSFIILAASGIVINFIIVWLRDMRALGIFNLSYAVYIVASQISVLGIHYSVMRYSALYEENFSLRNKMINTAIFLSLAMGILCSVTIFFGSPILGHLFHSPTAELSIKFSSFGLLLFPLNKILLGYLNGLREMKVFSILQSSRYIIVMIWVVFIAASPLEIHYITLGFFVAEFITTFSVLFYMLKKNLYAFKIKDISIFWVKEHLVFGGKGLLSGMFVELNSRVDVLLIGIYLSETQVGIYSFIAMLIDGAYHLLAMVKINFNPIIVRCIRDKKINDINILFKKSVRYIYPITFLLCSGIIVSFWVIANFILVKKGLQSGFVPLIVLSTCLVIISAFIPFDNILLSSGQPGYQTLQHLMVVSSNVLFNIFLIPQYGITGAAVATGASYFVGTCALIILIYKRLGENVFSIGSLNKKDQVFLRL